jgi:MoaA/NifB/PqqE/SkfB family radical SAM enzyme
MYSPLKYARSILWKHKPVQLTLFLTRRCNSKCPFCFYLRSSDPNPIESQELSVEEIGKMSRSLGPLFWVAFSGGEIYLRDDLAEISKIFHDVNKPPVILLTTNGMLPTVIHRTTERVLKECRKSIIAVKISLDGIGKDHDAVRATPGSFDKAIETYNMLEPLLARYPHFELGINTVFCSENQDRMEEIIDFVAGMKNIGTHTISLVRGNLSDGRYKKIDPEKYRAAIERLGKNLTGGGGSTYRFAGARVKAAQDILQRKLIYRTLVEQKRMIPCYAGRLNVVVTETGEVKPCELLPGTFGNIRDAGYDMRKVLRTRTAKEIVRSIRQEACFCTHECYFMTNILFNPKIYPRLFREYLRI